MKIKFIFLFILSSFIGLSQNNNTPSLPKIISASPEAASLGQYGGIPVNLSTGQINYIIPIYTIKSGDFEYPLTLSYNYNGFKPDTDPTMVGMGWTANFGGVIARQLKGIADEEPYIGYFIQGSKYENLNNLSLAEKIEALKNAVDHGYDTRPDKFILNTATINGSFRFKYDKTAVFSEQRNYKAVFNGFINVKDDKGILYQFNDTEHTVIRDWTWSSDETDYISSFMLSKIVLPNSNKELVFQYGNYNSIHKYTTNTKTVQTQLAIEPPANGGGYSSNFNLETTESKVIKRIDFPNGYILFDQNIFYRPPYSALPDPASVEGTYQVKLKSVSIYNLNNKLIDKFNFDYYDSGYYYYLKSIKKEDNNGIIIDYYKFDYENLLDVPTNKITNNMTDLWGFYNGKPFNEFDVKYSLNPSFDKGVIGSLTKITYPTKGTTEITYEPNQIKRDGGEYESSNPIYNASDFVFLSSENNSFDCDEKDKVVNIPFAQTVKITLEVDVTAGKSSASSSFLNSSQEFFKLYRNNEVNTGPKYFIEEHLQYLEAGSYKLRANLCEIGVERGNHNAKTTIEYRTIPYVDEPINSNIDVGGVRIAQTKDCPNSGSNNCVTKKYKYIDNTYTPNPLMSSGYLVEPSPRFKNFMVRKDRYVAPTVLELPDGNLLFSTNGGPYSTQTYYETTFSLKPMNPLSILGSHIFYSQVNIISNDESIGRTENYYTSYIKQSFLPFVDLNKDIEFSLGKVIQQNLLENKSGTLSNKQKQTNIYNETEINSSNYAFDFQVLRYPAESIATDQNGNVFKFNRLSDFSIQSVKHIAKEFQLTTTYTSFIEHNKVIERQTSFKYDPNTGYPTEINSYNSKGQEVITKTYYPNNKESIIGLETLQNQAINELINKNIISTPIQTETFLKIPNGSTLLKDTQRTNFKIWTSNNMVLPEFIKTAKGTDLLENQIQYYSYYSDGNLKELSKTNGPHTVYIWGYKNEYPIAKIENATTAQITTELGVSDISSLNETNLTAINNLRTSLSNAMITTYTYIPLVGVSTITDPKGDTITYTYDSFGRLQFVKDKNGNILSENQYNYKQ